MEGRVWRNNKLGDALSGLSPNVLFFFFFGCFGEDGASFGGLSLRISTFVLPIPFSIFEEENLFIFITFGGLYLEKRSEMGENDKHYKWE